MKRTVRMWSFFLLMMIGSVLAIAAPTPQAQSPEPGDAQPRVLVITLKGSVNPGSADFFITSIERAENEDFDAVVIELDTPGGLVESTRDIVQKFLASRVPIIVYVSPSGARAGSAGVMITMAAHVAAMAPGTNIGAAHPVAGGGQEIDETMEKKITNDTAAWIEGIAEQRGRNKEWAIKAVRDSVSVTATDALANNVVDVIAKDLAEALAAADGREVTIGADEKRTLRLANAQVVRIEPGIKHRFIMRLADPNIAYLLMIVGILGIYAEFSHPGMIFPGTIGVIGFLLFLMSTQILPINVVGVILIVVALALFVAEIKFTSYGMLTIGGALALGLGSLFLFDVPEKVVETPEFSMRVSWWLILPATIGFSLIAAMITFVVLKFHRRDPQTGEEADRGKVARVLERIGPDGGQVKFDGVIWNAISDESIDAGETVEVLESSGAIVRVKKTAGSN
ncbi:MAG: nodulation protein NfeD [Deltaproteobacteria bacterium]|nr:nodulation protein NfeD [Deltaproteobacteria bacterium]